MAERKTLYELHEKLQDALEDEIDLETGEITQQGLERLAGVEMELEEKALNVAAYIVSLKIKADGFKGEAESVLSHAKALKARQQSYENQAKRLTDYLQDHIEDGKKLENEKVRISWGTATSLQLKVLPELLPAWAQRQRDPEPDKKALAEALKDLESDRGKAALGLARIDKRRYVKVK